MFFLMNSAPGVIQEKDQFLKNGEDEKTTIESISINQRIRTSKRLNLCTVVVKSPAPSLTTSKDEIRGKLFYYVIA